MTKRRNPRAKSHPVPAPPAAVAEDSASIQPPDQPTAEVTHRQEFRVHQSVVVSPIPPPEHLAAYQAIQGDIPERLLQQVEKQAEHRRSLESRALSGRARLEILGLCLGFVVVITVVGGGLYLMATGQPWVGGTVLFVSLAGVARLFVSQQKRRDAIRNGRQRSAPDAP